jgi:hypothetical protein
MNRRIGEIENLVVSSKRPLVYKEGGKEESG